MFRKLRVGFSLILSLCLLLCSAGMGESEDPVVVRVGSFTYPQSMVQASLNSRIDLSMMLGGDTPDAAVKEARIQATVDSFVGLGVLENKLTEAGKNSFTDAEIELMNQTARSKYEELWQLLYQQMVKNDATVTEEAVTEQLEDLGYTFQAIYDELELEARQDRAVELYVGNIVLTQDQLDAYYEEQFVGPDREDYKDNVAAYDQDILLNNNEAFYTPEGYRYIRQIVLEIPEEAKDMVKTEQTALSRATQSLGSALQKLVLAVTEAESWDDLAEVKAVYDMAEEEMSAAQADYFRKLENAALPMLQEKLDEIQEQLDLGIDFKSLASKYSTDRTNRNLNGDGYPFHPESVMWPENFIRAASRLEKPGDVSEPFITDQGIHILCYEADVPSGEHVLTEDEQQLLKTAALRYYQMTELDGLIDGWKADYEIETHPELLKY